ncbi:MAG TPA: helix-turn-helix domain-containing protein [Microlunatus sp.]|nr:helix-turn-helix domain-containing protein [Microlunatus sp.]
MTTPSDRIAGRDSTVDTSPSPATGRRMDVLGELRSSAEPLSIADLAARLNLHPNTVRFHLDTLSAAHQVEKLSQPRGGRGRPPALFRASSGMDPAGPRSYRLLATILADTLVGVPDGPDRATAAGRRWGAQLADRHAGDDDARALLVSLLSELGFAPERAMGGDEAIIGLRHCPFLELASQQSRLICPVHLGMMQGVLRGLGATIDVERLIPFVQPDLCVVHLTDGT